MLVVLVALFLLSLVSGVCCTAGCELLSTLVLLADLIVAAVDVSGVGVGASFWCGLYRGIRLCKDPGFSRNFLQLHVIRGRHDWIDGDETESLEGYYRE